MPVLELVENSEVPALPQLLELWNSASAFSSVLMEALFLPSPTSTVAEDEPLMAAFSARVCEELRSVPPPLLLEKVSAQSPVLPSQYQTVGSRRSSVTVFRPSTHPVVPGSQGMV